MFRKLVHKVTGDPTQRYIDSIKPLVEQVNDLEGSLERLSDQELRERSSTLRQRIDDSAELDAIMAEAFALVREASRRTTGMRHFDVQVLGGVLLHRNEVVEMRTGEGKTLVATLPLFLNALSGRGAHLVTVNEYLARRDGGWMAGIYHLLGLSTSCIGPLQFSAIYDPDYVNPAAELEDERLVHWRPCTRQEAYQADITYGISSEFGFDYLRDNMSTSESQLVQRKLHFAVIDEVDNVLIDEARTPLIISGPADTSSQEYGRFAQYVRGLRRNTAEEDEEPNGHYTLDEKARSINLTEIGIELIEQRIPEIDFEAGDSLYDPRYFHLTYFVDNALRAQYLFRRDREYVVQGGEVLIVDSFTGRLMAGRRYSDGLHEAIEAKENVQVKRENVTVATITLQNYFRLYEKLAGMTGTAMTDAEEFHDIYTLDVTPLPTNVEYYVASGESGLVERKKKIDGAVETVYLNPAQEDEAVFFKRLDYPDQVFGTEAAKDQAIVDEIVRVRDSGRPVLVGTTSVEHSEVIHSLLENGKIRHAVLNAKMHQSEALTVAQAGRKKAVTISTNMAGRGTDIILGGNPEGLAAEFLEKKLFDRPLLARLATVLFASGRVAALEMTEREDRLTDDLVGALESTEQEFKSAATEIETYQLAGYLARKLQEPYEIDFNDARQVVALLRDGRQREARQHAEESGVDVAVVDEAQRLWGLHSQYQALSSDPNKLGAFLADVIFERNYNARATLIRSIAAGEDTMAHAVVAEEVGMPEPLVGSLRDLFQNAARDRAEVRKLGGLHVVGSERHESRRIDNQLRGRAARQGDPGSSRFFLSLEDDLMIRFGGERLKGFMARTNLPDDMAIESGMLDRIIASSQERIEGYNYDIRKNVVEYDDVMAKQREAIYSRRRSILTAEVEALDERVVTSFESTINDLVDNYFEGYLAFANSEIEQVVTTFTTEATNAINLGSILIRLRGLLPQIASLAREDFEDQSPKQLIELFNGKAHENLETGHNLYQFLQAVSRFVPLVPSVPNLAALLSSRKSGKLQAREGSKIDFLARVEDLYKSFLSKQIEDDSGDLWDETVMTVSAAFDSFSVESQSAEHLQRQQAMFTIQVRNGMTNLLIETLDILDSVTLVDALLGYVHQQIEVWRRTIGEEEHRNFQRALILSAIDREWRDYLIAMDDLRREIGLEAAAQRDPKVEYKRRSFQMFADMQGNIERSVVERYFNEIGRHQAFVERQSATANYQLQMRQSGYQVVQRTRGKGVELRREVPKVGRNDPCPCGSGKKYKQCHMRKD